MKLVPKSFWAHVHTLNFLSNHYILKKQDVRPTTCVSILKKSLIIETTRILIKNEVFLQLRSVRQYIRLYERVKSFR